MKRSNNINDICFQAAFWPALVIVFLSIMVSGLFLKHHIQDIYNREYNRHELINQLVTPSIQSNVIIYNKDALYVSLKDALKKYHLNGLFLSAAPVSVQHYKPLTFLRTQQVASSWKIAGLEPATFLIIQSNIDNRVIIISLLTSAGIILLFIIASMLMYSRIKSRLQSKIVVPLSDTLKYSNDELRWFDKKTAATEIVAIYGNIKAFIKTLHHQRDQLELHNINEAKYQVAMQVAHDIRGSALTLGLIVDTTTELKEESKRRIVNFTQRISKIADDVLAENRLEVPSSILSIGHIVETLLDEFKTYCPNKRITFDLIIDESCYHAFAPIPDDNLNRVLTNLINNAIEAISGSGVITVSLNVEDEFIKIEIKDTGCGIPCHQLKNIFKRGFTHKKVRGNGLGLFYAKEVIEGCGGRIEVQSRLGEGTLITIVIPV